MKRSVNIRGTLISAAIFILVMSINTAVNASQAAPKQRIEQEFRRLEAALVRCMHDDVLMAPEIEGMNRTLYDFMHDNPGVVRILRSNAGGYTVNDVSAGLPRSAPPRDISGQKWFKHVVQNKKAYYSMDIDPDGGEISLFYAWPLMAVADNSRFSGAFAAMIDFTAQVALIDDAAPFQLALRGKPFFQHQDWYDVDYNEAPLEIKGAQGLTVRTLKPMPTRLDPIRKAETGAAPGLRQESDLADDGGAKAVSPAPPGKGKMGKKAKPERGDSPGSGPGNTAVFLLLALIAAMLAYLILRQRPGTQNREPVLMPKPEDYDRVIVKPVMDTRQQPASPPPPPQQQQQPQPPPHTAVNPGMVDMVDEAVGADGAGGTINTEKSVDAGSGKASARAGDKPVDNAEDNNKSVDPQVMSKILKIIKDEFVIMDKKIQVLSQRIAKLENERK